jgi:phosphoribosylformylglycinamidine synthase PurS subunit
MLFQARVEVLLRPGHSDPEGETTARSLRELNYPVKDVRVGKTYTIFLDARSREDAEALAEEMCKRLLANPTKDKYTSQVEEAP